MKKFVLVLIAFFCCQTLQAAQKCERYLPENLLYAAQKAFEATLAAEVPAQRVQLVQEGLKWANSCVTSFPQEVACTYYRALLMGLQIEQQGFGFQKKLIKVVKDLEFVASQDPKLDAAGAYRTLAYIYLKAPEFSLKKKGITRDTVLAADFAQKALSIDPFGMDNRLLWAQILLAQEKWAEAYLEFKHLALDYSKKKKLNRQEAKDFKLVTASLEKLKKKKNSKD